MKNFIKKYPKRIIITALIVLLIAIVGTVNNYRTYRMETAENYYLELVNGRYEMRVVHKRAMEVLKSVYRDEPIVIKPHGAGVYYKDINLVEPVGNRPGYNYIYGLSGHISASISTDKEKYKFDETVTVTILNDAALWVDLDVDNYILQGLLDGGAWFRLRTGKLGDETNDEPLRLARGEQYSFEIPLEYICEEHNDPVKLGKGKYRVAVRLVDAHAKFGHWEWAICEFEIK